MVVPALSHKNPFTWDLAKPKLLLFLFLLHFQLCRIVNMRYLCKTVYSSKEEYSPQLQTGTMDV